MSDIHPTAIVSDDAQLGENVTVHPYTLIEDSTKIGAGCKIGPFAVVRRGTILGENCEVHTGAVLGEPPQDLKYHGEDTYLIIGKNNLIREFVTLHRATGEGEATEIGEGNLIMAYSHAGHNCKIGNHCLISNDAGISGHVVIEDYVNIGGKVGIHQFVTIGTMAMIGGMSRITRDVPPYCLVEGNPAEPRGINVRGLQRHDVSEESIAALRRAFRLIFRSDLNVSQALAKLEEEKETLVPEVQNLVDFLRRVGGGFRGRQANP